jgi:hypothetical protein
MTIFITILLSILVIFIISIIASPYIDNAIRFAKFKKQTLEQLKKRFSTLKEEKPIDFFYKMNKESLIFHVDYKLTMGGASDIYFEVNDSNISSILIISKFNSEKWFDRIKKTYITNRNEEHILDDSFDYGKEIYKIRPKEYSSQALKKMFPTSNFDFGINHNKKFFMYFY